MSELVKNRHPAGFAGACLALEECLTGLFGQDGRTARVYASCDDGDGFRVHEIDLGSDTMGCAWQRSDPGVFSSALILAAEDFVRKFDTKPWRPAGWQSEIDEAADARWKLEQVVKALKDPAGDGR